MARLRRTVVAIRRLPWLLLNHEREQGACRDCSLFRMVFDLSDALSSSMGQFGFQVGIRVHA